MAVEYFDRLGLDERANKRVELARQEAARMKRLLEEILLYAKPVALDLVPVTVSQTLARFIDGHPGLAAPRRQSILLAGEDSGAQIMADPDRLTQILLNLTQNACEAAPEGTRILWSVADVPEAGRVKIEVSNPGDPVPADRLQRLTEPFFSTKPSGTGLGLAIVRRLTLIHNGELSINSDEARGTRVEVSFPRHTPRA
jgi:signal transduction histidine kinase